MDKKAKLIAAIKAVKGIDLKWDKDAKAHVEVAVYPSVFVRDGEVVVSAEDGLGFVDYYGEFRNNNPYIHPGIVKAAKDNGYYWEWVNAGAIAACEL